MQCIRVYYKSINCGVSFSQGSVSIRYLGEGNMLFCMCKHVLLAWSSAKIVKIKQFFFQSYDHKCTAASLLNHNVVSFRIWNQFKVIAVASRLRTRSVSQIYDVHRAPLKMLKTV